MAADPTIYDQIWKADKNSFSVSVRNAEGNWVNPDADILLDHQVKAAGDPWSDLAIRPLFNKVKESRFSEPTYAAMIKLFDNYLVNYRDPEDFTPEENREITDFLDLLLDTQPMQLAYKYVTEGLGKPMSKDKFKQELYMMWFDPFTNYFGEDVVFYCSGFEHVFVGEGKFNRRGGPGWGEISGYHNWVKFYLDESKGRVNFLGTQYKLRGVSEVLNPNVVTLQMTWTLSNMAGNPVAQVFKERGGFFVGTSPECDLALGTVAYYESIQNLTRNERRDVTIQGADYNLVIYRETTEDNKRGRRIRSFYPEFRGGGDFEPLPRPGSTPILRPVDDAIMQNGSVVVVAALPNPEGAESSEWVELKNTSLESISLDGWFLTDKVGRRKMLDGTLAANEQKQFLVRTNSPQSMQLGNSGGRIVLYRPDGEMVASVFYNKAAVGEVINF
ncbi:MAG: lamin tail domain-containing protein [Scytonema hyalinum WJT4-NPBG1]|jgi:poly(U)-specific endoribonuclease|nr:lamin tail domain-containing protein [Scytonema hyalinum WJT4-NPBG1]